MNELLTLRPIGIIRTPFVEKRAAPRQPAAAPGSRGRVELFSDRNFEHALEDLDGFSHIWLLFWFDRNEDWRPKVLPPRSTQRRGLFATRAPHRPNPIGLSLVELERIDGLTLHVRNVDMLDGSPLLDIKPYVPYADYAAGARTGWLAPLDPARAESPEQPVDPEPGFQVEFADLALRQLEFLAQRHALDLREPIVQVLSLGPQPHPYRRIRRTASGLLLALKDWRAEFAVSGRTVTVTRIQSGYRSLQLENGEGAELLVHRAFVAEFDRP